MANYFTDRVVQYPGRVVMAPTGDSDTYDMSRAEGAVSAPGSPFNAETFNKAIDQYALSYGTCSTAAEEPTKVVSCPGFTSVSGATIAVKFSYENTYTGATYLNVNGTGAKRLRTKGGSNAAVNGLWNVNEVVLLATDGISWFIVGQDITSDELALLETALGL